MAWTQQELDALKSAYAAGTLVVQYEGKRVEYGSAADLLTRIRVIEADIERQSGRKPPRAGFASFTKG